MTLGDALVHIFTNKDFLGTLGGIVAIVFGIVFIYLITRDK
jgi:hypothetical protein